MKKSLPIILLSVFTLAFSAFGFMGIQPVKAATEVAGITIEDGQVGYEGVSITHADQALNQDGEAVSSGDGKMKFYSSLPQSLYNSLQGKDYKTGTLIIPAELLQGESVADKLNTLDITKVSANGAINVDTTSVWTLYDVDNDGEEDDVDDEYWAMASLYNIPRAYYGVEMAARSYLAVKEDGAEDYTYVYSATDDVTTFYSLTTTALKKLEAGDYDEKEELKTAITNDYTTFKVTFHFAELSELNASLQSMYVDSITKTYNYGDTLGRMNDIVAGTHLQGNVEGTYRQFKGFYNYNRTAFAVLIGGQTTTDEVSPAVGGNSASTKNDNYLTKVYGDMHLYEESAPANLLDDYSTAQSLDATYGPKRNEDGTIYDNGDTKYVFDKAYKHETASWATTKTGIDYKTGESVTESGVLVVPSQTYESDRKPEHYFHFTSSIRNRDFFIGNRLDGSEISDRKANDYYTGATGDDWDYLNMRVLIECTNPEVTKVPLKGMYGNGNYANQNPIATGSAINEASGVPVGQWINLKMDRGYVERQWDKYQIAPYRDNVAKTGVIGISLTSGWATTKYDNGDYASDPATYSLTKEGAFTLYIDYIAYERDMAISVNGVNGQRYESSSQAKYPWYIRYDALTSPIGDEVKLGTALTNGTIVYTVTDPDGENVSLGGELLDTFTPTKKGIYTVKATCDDYVLLKSGDYKFTSKQYGEITFEVVDREVTATLKNAEGEDLDLSTALMIGTEVVIDVKAQNVTDVTTTGTLAYNVKYLVDNSTVTITDGKFTPLSAGQYSIIVTYTDVHGYVNSSTEIILNTIGKEVNVTFSKGGETINIEDGLTMGDVITISATVEGIEEPIAENFGYKVTHIDSTNTNENNYEFEVIDGSFEVGFTGTYKIIVTYKEGEIYHSSTEFTATATTTLGYFNDFSDSKSVLASYTYNMKKDYTTNSIAPNTAWWASVEDANGVVKYGVISTKPQTATWSHGGLGINLRSYDYQTTTSWLNSGLTELVNGVAKDSSSTATQALMLHNDAWDYIVLPIYIPGEVGGTTYVQTVHGGDGQQVPNNVWYNLKLTNKRNIVQSFASRSLINQFANQTTNTPIIFLAKSDTDANYELNKDKVVYFDSMYFEKDNTYGDFTSVTMYEQVAGSETITAIGLDGQTTIEHYKPETTGGAYTAVASKSYWVEAKIGDKVISINDLEVSYNYMSGNATYTYEIRSVDGEGNVTITSGSRDNFNQFTVTKVLKKSTVADDTLGASTTSMTILVKYTDPDTGIVYSALKVVYLVPTAVDRPTES